MKAQVKPFPSTCKSPLEAASLPCGFTLIEVLVVVAILGILITLATLGFQHAYGMVDAKKAKSELEALRTGVNAFKSKHGGFPNCPKGVCTPGERLFLSMLGFHNEKGHMQIPPYPALVDPAVFSYGDVDWDAADLAALDLRDRQTCLALLNFALNEDIAFYDPWGNEYVYEFPRRDGVPGFRLFSRGPDGRTGKGFDEDNVE